MSIDFCFRQIPSVTPTDADIIVDELKVSSEADKLAAAAEALVAAGLYHRQLVTILC